MDHKEIKIYLAYSPEDLPFDREALGNFIRQQNDHARNTASPVYFHLIECEDMADLPEETDLVVSLSVHHGGGQKLLEDIWDKEDAPPVITFFRSGSAAAESLKQLQAWLSQRKIYWTEYRDPTVIMYKLLMHFSQKGQRAIFCKEDGDGLHVDGALLLKARDFSFLRDDQNLQQIDSQIARLEAEQNRLYSINQFAAGKQLNPEIDELKKQKRSILLAYFQWLQEDAPVSERQRQARIAAQNHDYSESKRLLSREIVDRDVENRKLKNAIENSISLQEYLSIATNLQMEPQTPEQIIEVRLTLMHAAALEAEHNLGTHARQTQVAYLLEWASAEDAVACASEFVALFDPDEISPDHARAQQLLAKAHLQNGPTAGESFACFEKALNIWNALRNADPDQWFPAWAECCRDCAAAAAAHNRHQYAAARKLLEEATEEFSNLSREEQIKHTLLCADLIVAHGNLNYAAGYYASSWTDYVATLQLIQQENSVPFVLCRSNILIRLGILAWEETKGDQGIGVLEDALNNLQQLGDYVLSPSDHLLKQELLFQAHYNLGVNKFIEMPEEACEHFRTALEILDQKNHKSLHNVVETAVIHAYWAAILVRSGKSELAQQHWNSADQICNQLEADDYGVTITDRIHTHSILATCYTSCLTLDAADDLQNCDSLNSRSQAAARQHIKRAYDLHELIETPDFRPTHKTWHMFANYLHLFATVNKTECRKIYTRCQHLLKLEFQGTSLSYALFLAQFAPICHYAGKYPEASRLYTKALQFLEPFVRNDPYLFYLYAKCAIQYSELLSKQMKRPKNAIDVLKNALFFFSHNAFDYRRCLRDIAYHLMRLYQDQPGCKKWEGYKKLYKATNQEFMSEYNKVKLEELT